MGRHSASAAEKLIDEYGESGEGGFACPQCGVKTRILRTTKHVRRRECLSLYCLFRFSTEEKIRGMKDG